MIDWNSVLFNIEQQEGVPVTTDPSRWNLDTPGYSEIYKMWQKANFNPTAIKWINYYPGKHYPEEIVNKLADTLGLTGVHRSWISRIDPGYMAPHHWDVDDNESEYLKQGPIKRYTVIIEDFAHGHIFILKDEYYHSLPKDTVIAWDNHREWHSGINAGMKPNYLLHILGY